ncbi:hypothetical protein SRB5_55950 [Streptomyces sp. RB5]|uniref:Uncharacterized protein n=1 Tax=Streptomyces smaragdinus TaxID=2585196 RepID=A0A7K0CQ11_9ACTN|nr:hypothetical protein [Streptomyces smaragdinus]MQY15413.1 hypothetical protein [Streptomyces smaragdinus]
MFDLIAPLLEPLLWFLWPSRGRHRRAAPEPPPAAHDPRPTAIPQPPPPAPDLTPPRVRPYVFAHEHRAEARRQRARRLELWLAVHGVDAGPRVIHGMEVPA